jgi:GntR family transcriptional regulator
MADPPLAGAGTDGVRPAAGAQALHLSVHADLCRRIQAGEFPPGSRLPGERELSAGYAVSRVTIRQALAKAEEDGLLSRAPGRGTFVSPVRVVQDLATIRPFRTSVEAAAIRASYAVRENTWIPAPPEVAEALGVEAGTSTLRIRLIGLANGHPLASYTAWIAPSFAEHMQANLTLLTTRSTYEISAQFLGVTRLEADQTFQAVGLDAETARLLHTPAGACAFRTASTYRTVDGRPVELRGAIYPGDRYTVRAHRVVSL